MLCETCECRSATVEERKEGNKEGRDGERREKTQIMTTEQQEWSEKEEREQARGQRTHHRRVRHGQREVVVRRTCTSNMREVSLPHRLADGAHLDADGPAGNRSRVKAPRERKESRKCSPASSAVRLLRLCRVRACQAGGSGQKFEHQGGDGELCERRQADKQ